MNLIITGANLDASYGNLQDEQKIKLTKVLNSYQGNFKNITIVLPKKFESLPINDFLAFQYNQIRVKYVEGTHGALCTALLAIDIKFKEGEIFVASADSVASKGYFDEVSEFLSSNAEAGTVYLEKTDNSWSYLRIRNENEIIEISEKRRISTHASTGFFMFRSIDVFLDGAEWAIKNSLTINSRYFLSGTLQSLIILNKMVMAFPLNSESVFESFRQQNEVK